MQDLIKPANLSGLTNTELTGLYNEVHRRLGERVLWLRRVKVEITKAKQLKDAGPISLKTLSKRQESWRLEEKECYNYIEIVEAEMDRRLGIH